MSAPTAGTLLAQDFAAGSPSGWSVRDEGTLEGPADWRIVAGELAQLSNSYGGSTDRADLRKAGTYLLYNNGSSWTDYRVAFRMRPADDDAMGLMFRYGDGNNYYRFSWDKQRSYRRLAKNVNGAFTLLAEDAVPYEQGRDYQVEIVAQGSMLEVWIDGARIFRVSDASHARGSIAFYTWAQSGGVFDNLTVQ